MGRTLPLVQAGISDAGDVSNLIEQAGAVTDLFEERLVPSCLSGALMTRCLWRLGPVVPSNA
jgi:hypothetical protein